MISLRACSTRACAVRYFSAEAVQEIGNERPRVSIPSAVKRGPTDLLKALSDTVGVDTTAPHFAFIDDPTMIPSTAQNKQFYYVAKEMGKRAARQLAQEWPTLFAFDRDQPRLPVFRPQHQPDPLQVEPTESNLLTLIGNRQVEDAIRLYERIRSGNVKIADSAKLELFKLVCYYNCANPPITECIEWHGLRVFGEVNQSKWKTACIADLLFESLSPKPDVVSIYISGLCKHATPQSVKLANSLFEKHYKEVTVDAYDAIISVSEFKIAQDILSKMKEQKLTPRLNTWNSILNAACTIKEHETKIKCFKSVIGEMIHLGQTPSLETFNIIINNIVDLGVEDPKNPSKDSRTQEAQLKLAVTWISDIIQNLQNSKITLQSAKDHLFFFNAMGIANSAGNLDLAERLVQLYESKSNEVKMPAFTSESSFYNRYLMLYINSTSSIEDIYKKYISLVPRIVGVGRQLTISISEKLKSSPYLPLLFRFIEDGIASRQMTDVRLGVQFRERLLDVPFNSLNVSERDAYTTLVKRLVDIWVEFSNFTEERNRRLQLKMSPGSICECALLLNRIGEADRAYELLELLLNPASISGENATVFSSGYPKPAVINELFDEALKQRDGVRAAICLEIMSQSTAKNKLSILASRITERCNLSDEQSRLINGFVRLRPE